MLSTTGMSPRRGSTTVPRKAEIANKIAVPIVERSPVVHIGGNSCKIALITGQLVPHATAIAARRRLLHGDATDRVSYVQDRRVRFVKSNSTPTFIGHFRRRP